MRTKGTGDFLFELDHTHITFSLIVIERDSEVLHKGEYLRFVSMESVEEVLGFGLFGFASTRVRLSWWRIGGKALLENLIVSSFKISKRDGIEIYRRIELEHVCVINDLKVGEAARVPDVRSGEYDIACRKLGRT